MTTEEKLIDESENAQWFALAQLADLAEEKGDPLMAAAWRYLCERRHYPIQWRARGRPINFWKWRQGKNAGHCLPFAIFVVCKRKTSKKGPGVLLRKAAEAIRGMLARREELP